MSKPSRYSASAPSNIALIKYMGKLPSGKNIPTNTSFSLSLPHLITKVELEIDPSLREDVWEPLDVSAHPGFYKPSLSDSGKKRYLNFLSFLKEKWYIKDLFLRVRSANNFPSDCGIASSASSFAALTVAAAQCFQDYSSQAWGEDPQHLSALSRQGSGSSCRSLFGEWAVWKSEFAEPVKLPFATPVHMVLLLDETKKSISSSEAHQAVRTSMLFEGRPERADRRYEDLVGAFNANDWASAFKITWAEFWDMHSLFHTAAEPFFFIRGSTVDVLQAVLQRWNDQNDGPIVTLDAGSNIHFLFRKDQLDELGYWKNFANGRWKFLTSEGTTP